MRPVPDHPASSDGSARNPSTSTVRSAGSTPLAIDLSLVDLERDARRIIGEMAYAYFSGGAEDERLLAEDRKWRDVSRSADFSEPYPIEFPIEPPQ